MTVNKTKKQKTVYLRYPKNIDEHLACMDGLMVAKGGDVFTHVVTPGHRTRVQPAAAQS